MADLEPALPDDEPALKGIAVVHGIGPSQQSSTLLDIGQPLFTFVRRWMEAQNRLTQTFDADLPFGTIDEGTADVKPHATLAAAARGPNEPAIRWMMAEAWWAQSFRQPGFPVMVQWAWRQWRLILLNVASLFWVRAHRALRPQSATDPRGPARGVDAVNNAVVLALMWMGFPLGVLLFGILFAAAQLPIKPLQEFIVVRLLQGFLVINIGQFRAFLEDEIQAANMRRRLESTLEYLAKAGCAEIYVIAHSGGVPIVFDVLAHPENSDVVRRVQKVFSLGEGLNKAWEIDPSEPRLKGPVVNPDLGWFDFYASYDPVPAGPLAPQRYAVVWPADFESNEITHRMDLLTDHGGYWLNDEQVLWRIAQEIDAKDHKVSQFFRNEDVRASAVKKVRTRVSILVGLRLFAAATYGAVLASRFPHLAADGREWWELATKIPGIDVAVKPIQGILDVALHAHQGLVASVAGVPGLAARIATLVDFPAVLFAAVLLAAPVYLYFQFFVQPMWERWDRRERDAALVNAAS